jgi:hypothetical protein
MFTRFITKSSNKSYRVLIPRRFFVTNVNKLKELEELCLPWKIKSITDMIGTTEDILTKKRDDYLKQLKMNNIKIDRSEINKIEHGVIPFWFSLEPTNILDPKNVIETRNEYIEELKRRRKIASNEEFKHDMNKVIMKLPLITVVTLTMFGTYYILKD